MNPPGNQRKAAAEIRFGEDEMEIVRLEDRSIYHFWHLLAPHFQDILLPPQRRSDDGGVAWSWREPVSNPPPTQDELAEVRRLLSEARDAFAEDETAGKELRSATKDFVSRLTKKNDSKLAPFVCRTDRGPRVHSWGADRAAHPYFPDMVECEVSGTIAIEGKDASGFEIVLENGKGATVAQTRSEAGGVFRMMKVPPGRYRIRAMSDRVDFPVNGIAVNVEHRPVIGLELRSTSLTIALSRAAKKKEKPRSAARVLAPATAAARKAVAAFAEAPPSKRWRIAVIAAAVVLLLGGAVWAAVAWWRSPPSIAEEDSPVVPMGRRTVGANAAEPQSGSRGGGRLADITSGGRTSGHGVAVASSAGGSPASPFSSGATPGPGASRQSRPRNDAPPKAGTDGGVSGPAASPVSARSTDAPSKNARTATPKPSSEKAPVDRAAKSAPEDKAEVDPQITEPKPEPVGKAAGEDASETQTADKSAAEAGRTRNRISRTEPQYTPRATSPTNDTEPTEPELQDHAVPVAAQPSKEARPKAGGALSKSKAPRSKSPEPASQGTTEPAEKDSQANEPAPASDPDEGSSSPSATALRGPTGSPSGASHGKASPDSGSPEKQAAPGDDTTASAVTNPGQPGGLDSTPPGTRTKKKRSTAGVAASSQTLDSDSLAESEDAAASTASLQQTPSAKTTKAPSAKAPKTAASSGNSEGASPAAPPSPDSPPTAAGGSNSPAEPPSRPSPPPRSPAHNPHPAQAPPASPSADGPVTTAARATDSPPAQPASSGTVLESGRSPALRLGVRIGPWELQALGESIVPTAPVPLGEDDALEILRERLVREKQSLIPAAFSRPALEAGFVFELPASLRAAGRPRWSGPGATAPARSDVRDGQAEIAWPHTATDCVLRGSDGRILARVTADSSGAVSLAAADGVSVWCWVGIERLPPDDASLTPSQWFARLDWKVVAGPPFSQTLRRDDLWHGGRGHRLEFPLDLVKPGARTLVLLDRVSGWGLAGRIEVSGP